jgi:hypothetical protein
MLKIKSLNITVSSIIILYAISVNQSKIHLFRLKKNKKNDDGIEGDMRVVDVYEQRLKYWVMRR